MLQVQLEVNSEYFNVNMKTNRIDVIAKSVKEAIQLASQFDEDLEVIMPEYMIPIDFTNDSLVHFELKGGYRGVHGDIFASKRTSDDLTYLCHADTSNIKELDESQEQNLEEISIYMDEK